jgi:hypothetical protein
MTTTTYLPEPADLCECGHEGLEGHDMRAFPPECFTCECGHRPEPECPGCGWEGYTHHHTTEDGPRSECCAHTCGR